MSSGKKPHGKHGFHYEKVEKGFVRRLLYPDVRLLYPIDFYLMTEREPRNRLL